MVLTTRQSRSLGTDQIQEIRFWRSHLLALFSLTRVLIPDRLLLVQSHIRPPRGLQMVLVPCDQLLSITMFCRSLTTGNMLCVCVVFVMLLLCLLCCCACVTTELVSCSPGATSSPRPLLRLYLSPGQIFVFRCLDVI